MAYEMDRESGSFPLHAESELSMTGSVSAAPGAAPIMLRADWVFPVSGPPIADGYLSISGGRIVSLGPAAEMPGDRAIWLRGSALIPGFVNPHAHLELSSMVGRIPRPAADAQDFTQWIRNVLAIRQTWGLAEFDESARFGIRLMIQAGTTTVGDVTASGTTLDPLIESPMRSVVFQEVLGFGEDRRSSALAACVAWLERAKDVGRRSGGRTRLGVSPHAPHSTSAAIYTDCCRLARDAGCLMSTHVSETKEEIRLIEEGTGPFRDFLRFRGLPMDDWSTPGVSPIRYMDLEGVLTHAGTAIHLNYLRPGDMELLVAAKMAPVYCPQSHVFLGHANHPAAAMLEKGLPLAIATDSLASNDSLEMLDEMRVAFAHHPEVPAATWLRGATLNSALALQMDGEVGSLAPGKLADFAVIHLGSSPGPEPSDPTERLLYPESRVVGTIVGGKWVFGGSPTQI